MGGSQFLKNIFLTVSEAVIKHISCQKLLFKQINGYTSETLNNFKVKITTNKNFEKRHFLKKY